MGQPVDEMLLERIAKDTDTIQRTVNGLALDQVLLRDRFAMAALTGMLASGTVNPTYINPSIQKNVAEWAYAYADAMLEKR